MTRRLIALLLALLFLCGTAAAQKPVYSSTRAFIAMLREAEVLYEANGVDVYGEESLTIAAGNHNIYCFFSADGTEVCFIVWYVIEYDPAMETEVMLACSRLNAASDGPRFYADSSDCTVTCTLDVVLPFSAAGMVAYRGYISLTKALSAAVEVLAPYDLMHRAEDVVEEPVMDDVVEGAIESVEDIVEEEIQISDVTEELPVPTPPPFVVPPPVAVPQTSTPPRPTVAPQSEVAERIVITSATARVRSGPGANSPYLCTVKQGESYPVIGVSGDWYIINVNGRTGFVSMTVAQPE